MSITKSIGKNTLGGGKKMNVNLRNYNRSTHDLSYAWRSSMTVGALVPFMKLIGLPGDTFDIALDTKVFTHPTIGPLFGSYKMQMDIFTCPMRLYIAALHNNALNVGMNMSTIKTPQLNAQDTTESDIPNKNNNGVWSQINPSSIMSYLGVKGWHWISSSWRSICALPLLSYLDIFKNYYANKQEENFYALIGDESNITTVVTFNLKYVNDGYYPSITSGTITVPTSRVTDNMYFRTATKEGTTLKTYDMTDTKYFTTSVSGNNTIYTVVEGLSGTERMRGTANAVIAGTPLKMNTYKLSTLDDLREYLLSQGSNQVVLSPTNNGGVQYITDILSRNTAINKFNTAQPLSGLLLKTYQSDINNNWIQTDWIDGENGISAITAIDTSSGEFTIDTLNLAKKVYDMLNRIAVSGGTYQDWIETVYTAGSVPHAETPIYEGGMSTEIEFEQVVSNSATAEEPLGTLAGRGRNSGKKGGRLHIKVTEPCYIMGIVSITPRVDYAQGMDWDFQITSLDDLHKPALDGIGFQDLLNNTMLWCQTGTNSVGKQPAWINYMTNVNKVYGNFAIPNNEMFMTLVKWFEPTWGTSGNVNPNELNVSSYIEPTLYNYIFADNSLDAQNFWVQIGCGIKARRVMSAKQIPNL